MSESVVPSIRRATVDDVPVLLDLRLAFEQEADQIQNLDGLQSYRQAVQRYLTERLTSGELVFWVAEAEGRASDQRERECRGPAEASGPSRREGEVVATGSLILMPKPPTLKNPSGLEAFVFNMYTIPAWRGQGLGTRILDEIISFVKATEARRIWLYASEMGEPVYAKAGFTIKQRHRPEMELVW